MSNSFRKLLRKILCDRNNLLEHINLQITGQKIISIIEKSAEFKVIHSRDGKLGTVENKCQMNNWDKNNNAFDFHFDGPYYKILPRYVILYCVKPASLGGDTYFTNSQNIIKDLKSKYDLKLLTSINTIYMSSDRYKYSRPLIETINNQEHLNWFTSLYLEPNISLLTDYQRQHFQKISYELITDIQKLLHKHIIKVHKWKHGDLLLCDNLNTLHGRTEIITGGRLLYRIWFDKHYLI